MDETPIEDGDLPPNLRFLRILVTILTGVMIAGLVLLLTLIVIRFRGADEPIVLPQAIALPDGAQVSAFTKGDGWYAVVTADQRILIYDAQTNALIQEIAVQLPN